MEQKQDEQPDNRPKLEQPVKPPQYEKFEDGLRRALAVPKQEIDRRQVVYESKRVAAKK